jgi:alpha-L-fucosidase 2
MEGVPLGFSHRHHSHLMGIYPLGVTTLDTGNKAARDSDCKENEVLITQSIKKINKVGYWEWRGWSFPWMSAICARAGNPHLAYWFLKEYFKFIRDNSMHVNGDSYGLSFSNFTYDPMTLEGGFCAIAAILEMLLQSHNGLIRVFPAVPASWEDMRFDNLRAEGAFIVSAMRSKGKLIYIGIFSEKGGVCKVRNDFDNLVDLSRKNGEQYESEKVFNERPLVFEFDTRPGNYIRLSAQPYRATAIALEKLGPTQVAIPRIFNGSNFFGFRTTALNPYHPDNLRQPQQ